MQALSESRLYIYFTPFDVPPPLLHLSLPPFFLPFSRSISRLFDSLSQSEWHGAVGNKWPLMDFLDVRSRAELRCSQECLGPRKYGGTLNYRNRWFSSLPLLLSLSLALSYRSFPVLSVLDRSQLRDLIDADENFPPSRRYGRVRTFRLRQ